MTENARNHVLTSAVDSSTATRLLFAFNAITAAASLQRRARAIVPAAWYL